MANAQISLNGNMMKIKDNGDGTYSTTTASIVQEIQLLNAVAIRNTSPNTSTTVDATALSSRKYFHVSNTLNQAVTIGVTVYTSDGNNGVVIGSKSIAAGTNGLITIADISTLSEPFNKISITATCSIAPASGSVSVWLEGVSA